MLKVTSTFAENEFLPNDFFYLGDNKNPPLFLDNIDPKAISIAVICDDPDAPNGTWVHWVAWNFPVVNEIPSGLHKDATVTSPFTFNQGTTDFGKIGYDGPCPPVGHGPHHYYFKVYVLDTTLNIAPGQSNKKDLEKAMEGHILQHGQIVGIYERK